MAELRGARAASASAGIDLSYRPGGSSGVERSFRAPCAGMPPVPFNCVLAYPHYPAATFSIRLHFDRSTRHPADAAVASSWRRPDVRAARHARVQQRSPAVAAQSSLDQAAAQSAPHRGRFGDGGAGDGVATRGFWSGHALVSHASSRISSDTDRVDRSAAAAAGSSRAGSSTHRGASEQDCDRTAKGEITATGAAPCGGQRRNARAYRQRRGGSAA